MAVTCLGLLVGLVLVSFLDGDAGSGSGHGHDVPPHSHPECDAHDSSEGGD